MGINIGLDIGAISLKLAALGSDADRLALEAVQAARPEFRLIEFDGRPLLLSDCPHATRAQAAVARLMRMPGIVLLRLV